MQKGDLTFSDFLDNFDEFGMGEWITVSSERENNSGGSEVCFSALIAESNVKKSLDGPSWDLRRGYGYPAIVSRPENGNMRELYLRNPNEGIEPLVIFRYFHKIKETYLEILEEFRLYFNLFEDKLNSRFIYIDDNGDEEDVILIIDGSVKIKRRFLKIFLALKKMRLALFFHFWWHTDKTIEELELNRISDTKVGDDFIYRIGVDNNSSCASSSMKSYGILTGKKLISGLKNFDLTMSIGEDGRFTDFIIGTYENGEKISCNYDPKLIADASRYLTSVCFRKDVLNKYYSRSSKYVVEDGLVRCGGLWTLRIDNNDPNFVKAYLGDLWELAYEEQLYWRSFNVPSNEKMSDVARKRDLDAEFTNPESSDLIFKQKFNSFQEKWEKKFGWKLFRPLVKEDEHCFDSLHVPSTNEQKEFEEQVLALTKILIDSLNEKELGKGIELKNGKRGIDKLEAFLDSKDRSCVEIINFFRKLQKLRSSCAAHRKGENYEKIKSDFSIGQKDFSKIFDDILVEAVRILDALERHVL